MASENGIRSNADAIEALTRGAALVYGGWALFFLWVLDRVRTTGATRIAGVWEQRLEALSFITLPPNAPVLLIAGVLASAATWMAGPTQSLELAILLRLTRWSANAMVVISIASALSILFTDIGGSRATVVFRLGGTMISGATSYLCLVAGRSAPGG